MKNLLTIFFILFCNTKIFAITLEERCVSEFNKDLILKSYDQVFKNNEIKKEKDLRNKYDKLLSNNINQAYDTAFQLYDQLIYLYGYCDYKSYSFRADFIYDLFSLEKKHTEAINFLLNDKKRIENILGNNNEYYQKVIKGLGIQYSFNQEFENSLKYLKENFELSFKLYDKYNYNTISDVSWYIGSLIDNKIFNQANKLLDEYEKYLKKILYDPNSVKSKTLEDWNRDYLHSLHFDLISKQIRSKKEEGDILKAYNKCLYHKETSIIYKDVLYHYYGTYYICKDIYFLLEKYNEISEILIISQNNIIEKHGEISNENLSIVEELHQFYLSLNNFEKSYNYAEQAFDIGKQLYPLHDVRISKLFNFFHIEESYIQAKKSEEIINILTKIISEWDKHHNVNINSPNLLKEEYYSLVENLSLTYFYLNQLNQSETIIKKLLDISNNIYGINSRETAKAHWTLATINFMMGKLYASDQNFRKQYDILVSIDPLNNNPDILFEIENNLLMHTAVFNSLNDYENQKKLTEKRLLYAKKIGEDSKTYLDALISYTDLLYQDPKTRSKADLYFEKCFNLLIKQFKKGEFKFMGGQEANNILLAQSYISFSNLYAHKGQYEKIAELQSAILDPFLLNKNSIKDFMSTKILYASLIVLSEVYVELDDYENALKYLNYSLEYLDENDASIFSIINYFTKIKILNNIGNYTEALKTLDEAENYINNFVNVNCLEYKDDCYMETFKWGLENYRAIVNADKYLSKNILLNYLSIREINEINESIKTLKYNLSSISEDQKIELTIQKHQEPILDSLKFLINNSVLESYSSFNLYMKNELEFRKNIKVDFKLIEMTESLISSSELSLPYQIGYNLYLKLNSIDKKNKILNSLFILTQLGENKKISNVINEMSQRSNIKDKNLSSLIKNKQDKIYEARKISNQINKLMQDGVLSFENDLSEYTNKIDKLNKDIINIDNKIASKSPEYYQFIEPKFIDLLSLQNNLSEKEAIIKYVLVNKNEYYVWVIKHKKSHIYHLEIKEDELIKLITKIRSSLDINNFSDFALEETKILYNKLFKIFEKDIEEIESLQVILDKPLDSLPFGLICKKCVTLEPKNYSNVDFLIKKYNFTYFPDIASFIDIRENSISSKAREKLIGFANPNLSDKYPLNIEENLIALVDNTRTSNNVSRSSLFESNIANASHITNLYSPLPETEEELLNVANYLEVSKNHLFFGNQATEKNVKEIDLSNYNIVYFATHGEVAGKFNDNQEPFLVLTPPKNPSVLDDGILTASEIMELELDADWVILSACSTATGDNPGAEGLTGLAKSFFYAGTRSILVTHWEVETNAATYISSETFNLLKQNSVLSKSKALQKAKLNYLNNASNNWQTHPVIWSPFIIVGDKK